MTQICCCCKRNKDCSKRNDCAGCEQKILNGNCPEGITKFGHGYCPECFKITMEELENHIAKKKQPEVAHAPAS